VVVRHHLVARITGEGAAGQRRNERRAAAEIQVMISHREYRRLRELLKYKLQTNRIGSPDEYLGGEQGAARPDSAAEYVIPTPEDVKRKGARANFLIDLYQLSAGLPRRENAVPPAANGPQEEAPLATRHGTRFNGMPSEEARQEARRQKRGKLLGVASDATISLLVFQINEIAAAQKVKARRGRPIATDRYLRVLRELDLAGVPLRDWYQSAAHRLTIEKLEMNESTAQSILRRLVDLRDNKTPMPREWRENF
jgi:hypothetical protein